VGSAVARAVQVGLIGWIRGERMEQNLDILAAGGQELGADCDPQPEYPVCGGDGRRSSRLCKRAGWTAASSIKRCWALAIARSDGVRAG